MKSWLTAVFCLACLSAAGCRTDPAVALLERENRDLEDRMYALADAVDDCRREKARLRRLLQDTGVEAGRPRPAPRQQQRETPDIPAEIRPPKVDVPPQEIPGEQFLKRFRDRGALEGPDGFPGPPGPELPEGEPVPKTDEMPVEGSTRSGPAAALPQADNTEVAGITLHDRLTGGLNADGRVGHEGIFTVIEPRDADGRLIAAAAPVSVVVLDPALPGEAARIARWDYTSDEIVAMYRKTPLSEGIHLEMVWPGVLPTHRRLHLFVRYTTDDGRKLEADRNIEIEVPALRAEGSPLPELNAPAEGANPAVAQWQRGRRQTVGLPPAEPARRNSLSAEPESEANQPDLGPAESSAPPSPRRPRRPVWSPDRL